MPKKFYITTAIAYTSRKPHIGNTYEVIFTDAIARYHRLKGEDVFFLTGTDEHGQKIEDIAKEMGIEPKQYVDSIANKIKDIWDLVGASYDHFIRTTDTQHEKTVQKIFKKLYDQGDIYKGEYEGWYCKPCESFFTKTQITDGCCPDCGAKVSHAKEEAYFFKMSKYQDKLMKYIEDNPEFIQPEARKNEMVNNFLKPGLQDLCVSRTSFKWGIPVSFDEKHVVYVWVDALSNYITAIGYDPDGSSEQYNKYWPADVHIIGKDILRFHTIYWPIILMALGEPLPKQVFGHPWMLFGKDKMSKSKGNVIYADDLVNEFGVDAVRYYVLSEMPFASDGAITYETVIARYNSDLANTLGNLVNRTVTMCHKYFDGVNKTSASAIMTAEESNATDDLIKTAYVCRDNYLKQMDSLHIADAIESIMQLARRANKYIDETAPWQLAKDESKSDVLQNVLFNLIETIRYVAVLLKPFMPQTSDNIFEQIGECGNTLDSLSEFGKYSSKAVGNSKVLFARLDEAKKLEELTQKYSLAVETPNTSHETTTATIDDFKNISLKAAQILTCEKVNKSNKLYKLTLDDGSGKDRQIVSGIALWYKEADLIGKKVIIISNLKPAKLCGVESNGMLLAADDGEKANVIFLDDSIAPGAKIR